MSEELVDARFEAGRAGFYVSAGAAEKHRPAIGGEIGVFKLPTSWSTLRLGLVGMAVDGLPSSLIGGVAGARIHLPTRVSPYAGVSGIAGYAQEISQTNSTTYDNNGNIIPAGTTTYGASATMAAIVPELGLYSWLTPNSRLSIGTSYYVTTDGRDKDFLFTGIGFEYVPSEFRDGTYYEPPSPRVHDPNSSGASEPYFRSSKNTRKKREVEPTGFQSELEREWWENSENRQQDTSRPTKPKEESPSTKTSWDE